ncbi:MAG TPA: type I restriction enzyme HsdR N-terminal domain-containing protein [Pirellulales bacterium]
MKDLMMETAIAGVTTCDYCRSRFKVQERQLRLEGKTIKCPKCHRDFIVKIERPSPVERAAIHNSEQSDAQRKRRTKQEIRKHFFSTIKRGMRPYHNRLMEIASQDNASEEEVRRWCIDVLRSVLGYEDIEIDTEMRALNQRIDIALKRDDKVFMVIECKNIRSKLPCNVRDQAVMYALNKSADWAAITNGQIWKLYRVFPVKGADPTTIEVFDLALLDEDGVSDDDIEKLYLLTSRAVFSGDSELMYHRTACLSNRRVLAAMTTPRVVKAIRHSLIEQYKQECEQSVKLSDDVVVDRVRDLFLPADL